MSAKKRARVLELPQAQLQIRERLKNRFQTLRPVQIESLAVAYNTALKNAASFSTLVENFARDVSETDLEWKCRPGDGVKSPTRILEKAFNEAIPLDFLGGKIIAPSLTRIYQIAQRVHEHFKVCGFKDRFETPQRSGYRDLQFQVQLENGHIAELKIVHRAIDQLDDIEHRIYEIIRMLAAKQMNEAETKVYDALGNTSKKLYRETWESILKAEVSQ